MRPIKCRYLSSSELAKERIAKAENGKGLKEKSLGFLSNGFIKLFLSAKSILSLEQAAVLLSTSQEDHKLKTKVKCPLRQIRRLYDIANVFLALGIIKKAHLANKKPAFLWRGVEGLKYSMHRLSDKSTASESSRQDFSPCEELCGLDLNKIFAPRPSSSSRGIHDTPQLKTVQDDFKLTTRSAFRLCQLFVTGEKENLIPNMSTPLPKGLHFSDLVLFSLT